MIVHNRALYNMGLFGTSESASIKWGDPHQRTFLRHWKKTNGSNCQYDQNYWWWAQSVGEVAHFVFAHNHTPKYHTKMSVKA